MPLYCPGCGEEVRNDQDLYDHLVDEHMPWPVDGETTCWCGQKIRPYARPTHKDYRRDHLERSGGAVAHYKQHVTTSPWALDTGKVECPICGLVCEGQFHLTHHVGTKHMARVSSILVACWCGKHIEKPFATTRGGQLIHHLKSEGGVVQHYLENRLGFQ